LNGPRVRGISLVGEEKVYGGSDLPKSQDLSLEWKTERVRKDENGDSEHVEDDELSCVGEIEGNCGRGSQRSVGSSFHRQDAAYEKKRLVIFKELSNLNNLALIARVIIFSQMKKRTPKI